MAEKKDSNKFEKKNQFTLNEAKELVGDFVRERNWQKFQTPRNLTFAMIGEVGELAEIFQWKG